MWPPTRTEAPVNAAIKEIADAVAQCITSKPYRAPRGPGRIEYQWSDYGGVTFSAVITYQYEPDADYIDGHYRNCTAIDLRTCTVTHINGKAVPEFECSPYDIPGFDIVEDAISDYEQRGGL